MCVYMNITWIYIYMYLYVHMSFIYIEREKYLYVCICLCEFTCIFSCADDLSITYIDTGMAGETGHLLLLPWVAGRHCMRASVISRGLWGIYQPRKGV